MTRVKDITKATDYALRRKGREEGTAVRMLVVVAVGLIGGIIAGPLLVAPVLDGRTRKTSKEPSRCRN